MSADENFKDWSDEELETQIRAAVEDFDGLVQHPRTKAMIAEQERRQGKVRPSVDDSLEAASRFLATFQQGDAIDEESGFTSDHLEVLMATVMDGLDLERGEGEQ